MPNGTYGRIKIFSDTLPLMESKMIGDAEEEKNLKPWDEYINDIFMSCLISTKFIIQNKFIMNWKRNQKKCCLGRDKQIRGQTLKDSRLADRCDTRWLTAIR